MRSWFWLLYWKRNMASKNYRKNDALYSYNNHYCLIWKSKKVSFKDAIKEFKKILKIS